MMIREGDNPPVPENVDEVLWLFQQDLPTLVKDKKGQVGNQKTKYADLTQANEVILTRLNALACIWVCEPTIVGNDPGRFALAWELKHVPSGTARRGQFPILGDSPMKHGAAITYARRYSLLAVTGVIPEDEDDDGQSFEDGGSRYRPSGRAGARADRSAARPAAGRTRHGGGPPLPGEEDPNRDRQNYQPEELEGPPAGPPPTGEHDPGSVTQKQHRRMQALWGELGYGGNTEQARTQRLEMTAKLIGVGSLETSSALSFDQAQTVITRLTARRDMLKEQGKLPGQQAGNA